MYSQPWTDDEQGITDTPYHFSFTPCTSIYATQLSKTATPYVFGKLYVNNGQCLTWKKHKNIFVQQECSYKDTDVASNHQTFAVDGDAQYGEVWYAGTGTGLNAELGNTHYVYKGIPVGGGNFTITLDFKRNVTDANSFGTFFDD